MYLDAKIGVDTAGNEPSKVAAGEAGAFDAELPRIAAPGPPAAAPAQLAGAGPPDARPAPKTAVPV